MTFYTLHGMEEVILKFGRATHIHYYEFRHAHEFQIEKWHCYQSSNYVSITKGIIAPSGAMSTTPSTTLVTKNESASGSGITKMEMQNGNGTTRGGGMRLSLVCRVLCLHSTMLWNSSKTCEEI
jgi:hypothetical protein